MKKRVINICIVAIVVLIVCGFTFDKGNNQFTIKNGSLYRNSKIVAVVYDDAQDHYDKPDDFLNSVFVNHVSVIGQKKAFDIDGGYCNLLEVQIEPTAAESENGRNKTITYNAYLIVTKDRNIVIDPEPSNYDDKILEDDGLIKFLKKGDFDI